ncbi:rCG53402, isoform CRA_a [Rattus norvegicus]|uniref:RCG53402, isoform CRA_a n=1 Tax=Rattus norvegicus TaxID=10116 RepID=A6JRJ6_RAT|nr:rCG53402, isoform CRA_a [Rattus norvegicus]
MSRESEQPDDTGEQVIDTLPGAQDSKGKDGSLPSRCTPALTEDAGPGAGMYLAVGLPENTMQDAKIGGQLIVLPSSDTFQSWQ